MGIRVTSSSAANTVPGNAPKVRATTMLINAAGLRPNSSYTLSVNGVDMTWACRTSGKRMGSGLTSDSTGSLAIIYSAEIVPDQTQATNYSQRTKYNNFQIKDINGRVVSASVTSQLQVTKGQ